MLSSSATEADCSMLMKIFATKQFKISLKFDTNVILRYSTRKITFHKIISFLKYFRSRKYEKLGLINDTYDR